MCCAATATSSGPLVSPQTPAQRRRAASLAATDAGVIQALGGVERSAGRSQMSSLAHTAGLVDRMPPLRAGAGERLAGWYGLAKSMGPRLKGQRGVGAPGKNLIVQSGSRW